MHPGRDEVQSVLSRGYISQAVPLDSTTFKSEVLMGLSREELIDLATRYTTLDQAVDFPYDGDLFCILMRPVPENPDTKEEDGWIFSGYGICIGYTMDEEAKPMGKWIWMHFASLNTFPQVSQVLKLQPPHIIKGRFQNANRTQDVKIIRMGTGNMPDTSDKASQNKVITEAVAAGKESFPEGKIVQFRKKKSTKSAQ